MTAPFEVEYGVRPLGRIAEIELMLTIEPPPASAIVGIRARETRYIDATLTFITRSQKSGSVSRTVPGAPMPTLLISTVGGADPSPANAARAAQSSSLVTSPTKSRAAPPSSSIIATVPLPASSSRSTTTTSAPARARRIAAARPLPIPSPRAPPPVTTAVRPRKSIRSPVEGVCSKRLFIDPAPPSSPLRGAFPGRLRRRSAGGAGAPVGTLR